MNAKYICYRLAHAKSAHVPALQSQSPGEILVSSPAGQLLESTGFDIWSPATDWLGK